MDAGFFSYPSSTGRYGSTMIYDKLQVTLLSELASQRPDSAYAQIARHILAHPAGEPLSIKQIASSCHVGTGTVSRFARDVGFSSFGELREACEREHSAFETIDGKDTQARSESLARRIALSVATAAASIDQSALHALIDDLRTYQQVSAYGLLKAQAAATNLQVDLLMQGKQIYTCATPAEQEQQIASTTSDELVLVFSYTGTFFEESGLLENLRRADRPRIWMICGSAEKVPSFVHRCLLFASDHSQLGHPYQLECVAGIIAQEYAATSSR